MTIKPVAWMHPSENWCAVVRKDILNHCMNNGPEPKALVYHNEAMAEIERLQAENVALHQQLAEARNKALDEAAAWHYAEVQSYTDQIAVNNAYIARGGRLSHESRANEYCDDQRSTHRRSAAAIRALKDSAP